MVDERRYSEDDQINFDTCLRRSWIIIDHARRGVKNISVYYVACSISGKSKISPTNSATFVSFLACSVMKSSSNS